MRKSAHRPCTGPGVLIIRLCLLGFAAACLAPLALPARGDEAKKTAESLPPLEKALIDARSLSRAFTQVAKMARPGVVHLRVSGGELPKDDSDDSEKKDDGDSSSEGSRELRRWLRMVPPGAGSGIIFDANGYILTNNHVVENRDRITAVLQDEREFNATVIGTDPKTDLAVIKIDAPDLHALPFGDSDALEVGELVIAVGSPFGLQQTVTHGIISAKDRTSIPGVDIDYQDFLQTDAAINPGNSGGPLLNLSGEVVGVNTAIATRGDGYNAGVAFTIPSKLAMKIADELKNNGSVKRGYIGIRYRQLLPEDAELYGLDKARGVIVDMVQRRSPADRAGIEPEDVIVEFNGDSIDGQEKLRGIVGNMKPDERVKLRVLRDGEERNLDLRLGLQPANLNTRVADDDAAWITSRALPRLGIEVQTIPPTSGRGGVRLPDKLKGVLVKKVDADGPAALAVDAGDLITSCNGNAVTTVANLKAALKSRGDGKIRLQVQNIQSGETRTVTIAPAGGGAK